MKGLTTYLSFDGNCREAMEFYQRCLGGELVVMPFSDAREKFDFNEFPNEAEGRIMHASLTKDGACLMASDVMPGMTFQQGNNFSVSVACETLEETETLFAALGENGRVAMPLADTFWGARFGMVTDQFGIHWMFNFENTGAR